MLTRPSQVVASGSGRGLPSCLYVECTHAAEYVLRLLASGWHSNCRFAAVGRPETSMAEMFCTYAARNFRVEARRLQISAGPASRCSAGRPGLRPGGNRQDFRMIKPCRDSKRRLRIAGLAKACAYPKGGRGAYHLEYQRIDAVAYLTGGGLIERL